MDHESLADPGDFDRADKGYALSGKIMLSAIVIFFFVVILMVCLHLYARWYLLRARRRNMGRNRHRRTHLVFHVDPAAVASTRGLDASVLKSLPVFVYTPKTDPETNPKECAVCLSEFEENETGRLLPKCNHSFHTDCIDMWFKSHSTCPLCRSPVEPDPEVKTLAEVVVTVDDEPCRNEPGPSSGMCSECEDDRTGRARSPTSVASSSFGTRRKPMELVGVSIEVPRRNESFGRADDDTRASPSPASQSLRSPISRMLSFKRILSWERRGAVSPSGNAGSCITAMAESDIERGREATQ